jgi:hypothetical protein
MSVRNLFNQLFTFHAKENFSAKENFLTEAFAYLLQTNKAVCEAFVGGVIGSRVQIEPGYDVTTRMAEHLNGKRRFPNLGLSVRTSEGVCWRIFSEHKWDSPVRADQLIEYADILNFQGPDLKPSPELDLTLTYAAWGMVRHKEKTRKVK